MIAITGANGLLGSFILKKFLSENQPVTGLKRKNSDLSLVKEKTEWRDADVTDSTSLVDALENIDTVVHTAAVVSFDPRAKERIFNTNVNGTRNVVDACLALGIPRLIFVSSVAALGRAKGLSTIDEENKWVDSNLNSDYAKSKYLAELEVYRGQEEGLNISIVNPSVILAPANSNKSSAQIFNYVQKERPFYTDGQINYVDVRDVSDLIFKLYSGKNLSGEKFIASGGQVDLNQLMQLIANRLGKKVPSIKINNHLLPFAAWLEEMRCRLTGAEAVVSRQSVKMPNERYIYQNHKSINRLNMAYRPLNETLNWCCDYYRTAFTTNKQH